MKQRIKDFWIKSYTSDKTAFCCEMFSFVVTVAASLTLAITAAQPNMLIVYPGFFIGSTAAVVAYYRRGLAWPLVLTTYFALNNIFGFGRAAVWW